MLHNNVLVCSLNKHEHCWMELGSQLSCFTWGWFAFEKIRTCPWFLRREPLWYPANNVKRLRVCFHTHWTTHQCLFICYVIVRDVSRRIVTITTQQTIWHLSTGVQLTQTCVFTEPSNNNWNILDYLLGTCYTSSSEANLSIQLPDGAEHNNRSRIAVKKVSGR
jgi:hypothetical protein